MLLVGADFGSTTGSVTINGATATITSWSASQIVVMVPSTTSGNIIVIANSTPSSGTPFTVAPIAVISGISVNSGTAGTSVTVTGSSFGASADAEAGKVVFNGATAPITSWSDTSIVAQVPNFATPGQGSLQVSLGGVVSNSFTFTVIPTLDVSQLGSSGDGIAVITGANLGSVEGIVNFNGASSRSLTGLLRRSQCSFLRHCSLKCIQFP